jgi:hypothetical protein
MLRHYKGMSETRTGFGEDALVAGLVGGDDVVGAEFLFGVDAGSFAHFATAVGAGQEFDDVAGGFFQVAGCTKKPSTPCSTTSGMKNLENRLAVWLALVSTLTKTRNRPRQGRM